MRPPFFEGQVKMEHRIVKFTSVDSTNDECERRIKQRDAHEGDIIVAKSQTSGHGTRGRSFFSEDGLYFTVILTDVDPSLPVTAAAAVAVARAADAYADISCKIKWVNDIFLDGRKLAGILSKRIVSNGRTYTLIGIGINTNTEHFPPDLSAISLKQYTSRECENSVLLERIIGELDSVLCEDFMYEYRARSMLIGCRVTVSDRDSTVSGIASRINGNGSLTLLTKDGERTVFGGSVTKICR